MHEVLPLIFLQLHTLQVGKSKTYYRDKKKTVYKINFTIYFKGYDDTSDDGSNFFFKNLTIEDGKVTDYCD